MSRILLPRFLAKQTGNFRNSNSDGDQPEEEWVFETRDIDPDLREINLPQIDMRSSADDGILSNAKRSGDQNADLLNRLFAHQTDKFDLQDPQALQQMREYIYVPQNPGFWLRLQLWLEYRWMSLKEGLVYDFQRELEHGNLANFAPLIVGSGIVIYFTAGSEPSLLALLTSTLLCLVFILRMNSRGFNYHLVMIIGLAFAGMLAAKIQVLQMSGPIVSSELRGKIAGVVTSVDANARGSPRYTIAPTEIEGLTQDQLPELVRVSSSSKHEKLQTGDQLIGTGRLMPFSGPAYPGAYDFSFFSRMEGLGYSGFLTSAPTKGSIPPNVGLWQRLTNGLQVQRQAIGQRLRAGLPGEAGDIAVALITGDRSGLSKDTQESLRRSGLAHILAISGLHMALVTLTIIWCVRFGLAVVPGLAERYNLKKWAILAGFIAATGYLFISGFGVATQRAWLMISVMLTASLLDRQAITMRSVVIAALAILIFSPASLFHPGFQMSFAAVAALVAVFREWTEFSLKRKKQASGFGFTMLGRLTHYFGGLAATSLIAGLATTLFAAWHFHRIAPMGLVANLGAMPLVSLFVMPLALASILLMPYGLEGLALQPLGYAIGGVLWVSDQVNLWNTDFETGLKPIGLLISSTLLLIMGCGFRTRLRLILLLPLCAIAFFWTNKQEIPDLVIAQDGRTIAMATKALDVPQAETTKAPLTLAYPGRNKFVVDIWQKAWSPNQKPEALAKTNVCDKNQCRFVLSGKQIAIIYDPRLLKDACDRADVLIAPRLWWVNCNQSQPKLILKRGDFERNGVHTLNIRDKIDAEGKPISAITVATGWTPVLQEGNPVSGRRPWLQRLELPKPDFGNRKPEISIRSSGSKGTNADQMDESIVDEEL